MTIEFKDGRYFESVYFLGTDGWDFHGALYKDGDGPWIVQYRFRYYAGDEPDDARDRKNWYAWQAKDGTSVSAQANHGIMREMFKEVPPEIITTPFSQVDLQTADQEAALTRLLKEPWFHMVENAKGGDA